MLSRDTPHKNAYITVLQEAYQKQIFEKLLPSICQEEFPTQAETNVIKNTYFITLSRLERKIVRKFFYNYCLRICAMTQKNNFKKKKSFKTGCDEISPKQTILTRKGSCIHLPNFYWRTHVSHFYAHFIPHRL